MTLHEDEREPDIGPGTGRTCKGIGNANKVAVAAKVLEIPTRFQVLVVKIIMSVVKIIISVVKITREIFWWQALPYPAFGTLIEFKKVDGLC